MGSASLLLLIPGLKTIAESNAREHWGSVARRKKAQQNEVHWSLVDAAGARKAQLLAAWREHGVDVHLVRIGPNPLDEGDNLSSAFKSVRDAIASFIGIDDGDRRIKFTYDQDPVGRREYAVQILITERVQVGEVD